MSRLCNDVDILKYEPALFGELHLKNQVLATGADGELAGTTFEAESADFVSAGVEAGDCIYLKSADGALDGVYEIAAVDSATQFCVSVLREDSQKDPVAPPTGTNTTGITYRVSTLGPQIAEVSLRLMEYLWIRQGEGTGEVNEVNAANADEILNTDEVRQLCALGTAAAAYRTLAAGAGDENLWSKGQYYEQLFGKGMERCRVAIDKDGDDVTDSVRFGGCGRLIRD